ncbi:energy-coupling factor ABC transporter ATP-binding protein [bacterium]|nr:energy-coupling factor ABC transporter ATP-binding protein [bacterium]
MNIIEIKDLCHNFANGSPGIIDINLTIKKGEFIVIAGQNGSGKTTLCRHLNGLLSPASGSVLIKNVSVKSDPSRARQIVGMVFQNADSQIVGETVYSDIAFGPENLRLNRKEIDRRVKLAMEAVGLQGMDDHRPHTLSGGEKRKLAIAGVLAMNPEILVFDEPFSNLDYPGERHLLRQILDLHQTGHTILIITHELEKVVAHADRLVIMRKGRIVKTGIPHEIIHQVEDFGIREPCSSRLGHGVNSWLN